MSVNVFIDGSAGTTGLRLKERLSSRDDIKMHILEVEERKDPEKRREAIRNTDIAFLCLPDDAAREAAVWAEGADTVVIDTSTAHRVDPAWTYGFPELKGAREKIAGSKRIANPGCHASGFISLAAPLVENGILPASSLLSCFSLTGYSGGGKKMIAEYEAEERDRLLDAPRQYGTGQTHKHLPEMQKVCGLETPPVFCPIVADYYSGMEVTIPLFAGQVNGTVSDIRECYREYYRNTRVHTDPDPGPALISGCEMAGRDDMVIRVAGNDERILLVSVFDNLGKGASGAAIQNMNIVLGLEEFTGLVEG